MTDDFIDTHLNVAASRGGRSPRDGYDRGSGLKYRGLDLKISAQADYREALSLSAGRSIVRPDRLMNLYLLIRYYLPKIQPGHIIEYGTFRGGGAIFMAALARRYLPGCRVYGLDTFEGLPTPHPEVDGLTSGIFAADFGDVKSAAHAAGLSNLTFIKGLFSETATDVLRECGKVALAHIDCDLFEPVGYAYEVSRPFMVPGGYIVFDDAIDATCLGATEAVENLLVRRDGLNAEQAEPHLVFRYPPLKE